MGAFLRKHQETYNYGASIFNREFAINSAANL